jgi:hypothetical protein
MTRDGKTMDNEILAEILDWIRLAKGDVPGHTFHGNQYSDVGGMVPPQVTAA